ncbi:unnamed protein product, partial [Didymodactylos carnosus]
VMKDKATTTDKYYIITQRVDCDLTRYIEEKVNTFTPFSINNMIIQIINGLKYIHDDVGLIHRDMKPPNILVEKNKPSFLIADFGFAHREPMSIKGTRGYFAPELLSSYGLITEKSDIYSLGVIIRNILEESNSIVQYSADVESFRNLLDFENEVEELEQLEDILNRLQQTSYNGKYNYDIQLMTSAAENFLETYFDQMKMTELQKRINFGNSVQNLIDPIKQNWNQILMIKICV